MLRQDVKLAHGLPAAVDLHDGWISSVNSAPFAEAGEAAPHLLLSSVFRNDPAYRRFFRLWRDMNLGIAAVFSDFLSMPLARTFELYELWCFLHLVLRAAAAEYGPQGLDLSDLFVSDAAGGVTVAARAVAVPVGGGWKLCFQKRYREFWLEPGRRGTFSRTMNPDVVMSRRTGGADSYLIVLDAKYQIEEGLNDALNSIHTYRDALVREVATEVIESSQLLTFSHHIFRSWKANRDTARRRCLADYFIQNIAEPSASVLLRSGLV